MLLEKDHSKERNKHLSHVTEEGHFAGLNIYYGISSCFWSFKEKDGWPLKISGKTCINFALTEFLKPKMIMKYAIIAHIFSLTNTHRECICF